VNRLSTRRRRTALGLAALVTAMAAGCSGRLDLPQEPDVQGGPTGDIAYVKKYAWEGLGRISDLVLTRGQNLYGVEDSSRVTCWFSDTAVPRPNPGRSIPDATLEGAPLGQPVRISEGHGNTLWVAYRSPRPLVVQWNIGVVPPVVVDSGFVRLDTLAVFGGIAADTDSDFVYIADSQASTITKWKPTALGGRRVTTLATQGNGDHFVQSPNGIFFFSDSLLVADTGKDWLQVLDADVPRAGRGQVTGPVGDPLQVHAPLDVWVDGAGYFYVADADNARVVQLTSAGVVKRVVTQYDADAPLVPNTLAASETEVWVVDPQRLRLTIYQINTTGEELP
jgi:sugar lactone lactonase YvrE